MAVGRSHMKTRILILLGLFAMAGARPPEGQGDGIYIVGEGDIYARMVQAESLKNIFLHAGDTAWAAYYAGRESVFREQLNVIFTAGN